MPSDTPGSPSMPSTRLPNSPPPKSAALARGGSSNLARSSPASASPSLSSAPSTSAAPAAATSSGAKASGSSGLGISVGRNAPRNRSIHINIKPDPGPSSSLPAWLTGGGGASTSGSSTSSPTTGSVPHRDFGMSPHSSLRRGSDPSSSHAAALAAIHRRGSSQTAAFGNTGSREGSSSRWATTIRNQIHRIERDGMRRTLWSRGRQLGSGNTASTGILPNTASLARAWDRVRRIPDLLFVESEDPVSGVGATWANADAAAVGDGDSSDTSDLFEEKDEKGNARSASTRKQHIRRRSSVAPATHLQKIGRAFDRARKALGMSRGSFLILLLLLVLGFYELLLLPGHSSRGASVPDSKLRVYPRDPFKTLARAGIRLPPPSSANLDAKASQAVPPIGVNPNLLETALAPMRQPAKSTAILLNWKRTDNLIVIVTHLCAFGGSIFDSVQIWNNNPETTLTHSTFAAAQCPKNRLRIYNSPGNLLFMARYMACAQADTPYCYFQDDDWLVPTLPALHAHFQRNPEGPTVVAAGDEFPMKSGWEWCFYNTEFDLNTCFAWLGFGSFVSRAKVLKTLDLISSVDPLRAAQQKPIGVFGSDDVSMLDNAVTTLQNEPPYVLGGRLIPMDQSQRFSTKGEGDIRNKIYIQRGLDRLLNSLGVPLSASPYPPPLSASQVDIAGYSATVSPLADNASSWNHPYWHHSRSVSRSNDMIFLTNVASLPPPHAVEYKRHPARNISLWEQELASPEIWGAGKAFAEKWTYESAVDGAYMSAWRSPDTIKKGDYIGLDLLAQIDVDSRKALELHFLLEHSDVVVDLLRIEVSIDGYNWQEPRPIPAISCSSTSHLSTLPSPSLPTTFMSSQSALSLLAAELADGATSSTWGRRKRLNRCSVKLGTSVGGSRRKGWRFVRLRSDASRSIGWGVYEIWVD